MASHGTVEHCQSFDVHVLYRMGALREPLVSYPWVGLRWPGLVRLTTNKWRVDVEFRGGALQRIPLVWSRCHFGGFRPWFKCARCNRQVGKLYNTGASLTCRRCLDLWYASQRRGVKSRHYLKALKLRLRLNGVANLRDPMPERPKGMHKRTYERLRRRLQKLEEQLCHSSRFVKRETDYAPLVPK
jgi:DNA-directed RNA polymerase subunit RPC12/RpoP